MRLHQARKPKRIRNTHKARDGEAVEQRRYKKHCVRAYHKGFIDLVSIDNEILAQDRQVRLFADRLQIFAASPEIMLFRKYRNCVRPRLLIFLRDPDRRKILTDHPL